MALDFVKGPSLGYFRDGGNLRGLWFAKRSGANDIQIRMCISSQDVEGYRTSDDDYDAATTGLCRLYDGPAQIGGYVLMFPSAGSFDLAKTGETYGVGFRRRVGDELKKIFAALFFFALLLGYLVFKYSGGR